MNTAVNTIDEYIAGFPASTQEMLNKMRAVIRKAAPKAVEKIGYGIPTFVWHGNLVHFGGFKNHLGFYPGPGGIEAFKKELAGYKMSKGTIQMPLDKPLPVGLITKIVKFRIKQNEEAQKIKSQRKPKKTN